MTLADEIPVAKTPPGGYGKAMPPPILAGCTEVLAAGAPDLRGLWKVVSVEINGQPAPAEHPIHSHVERIEQGGNRVVVTAGGLIHDMRADGTQEMASTTLGRLTISRFRSSRHSRTPCSCSARSACPGSK